MFPIIIIRVFLISIFIFFGYNIIYIIKQKRRNQNHNDSNNFNDSKHFNTTIGFGKVGIMIINIFITLACLNIFFYDYFGIFIPRFNFYSINAPIQVTGLIFAMVGNILLNISYRTLGIYWEYPIDGKRRKRKLVTDGIYSRIRHPIYLSFYLICIGMFLILLDLILLILLFLGGIGLYLQALEEEKTLYEAFGNEYMNYKKQTGRFFAVRKNTTPNS